MMPWYAVLTIVVLSQTGWTLILLALAYAWGQRTRSDYWRARCHTAELGLWNRDGQFMQNQFTNRETWEKGYSK